MRALLLAAALAACSTTPSVQTLAADPIIAAERTFAAEAAARGWVAAFRAWHAPGAVTLSPGPVSAAENLAQIEGDGETTLDWRPAFAGVSRDGGFGFTTGPFLIRGGEGIVGHYFTVWRRQPDGAWKWIFDAGAGVVDPGPATAPDARIPTLPVAAGGAGSADAAVLEVRELERHIAIARPDPRRQLQNRFAGDIRLNRGGRAPAVGRAQAIESSNAAGIGVSAEPLEVEASAAGDMVFVLGASPPGEDGRPTYHARIWQWRPDGWRIVFDETVPHRGPPPPEASPS